MRWSPRIATVAGIPIRVHWSFAGLVLLVVAATAESGGAAVATALGWLALLFGSVVVHELAHSVVARHRGIEVRDIVLLPIGGASEISDIARTPADELHIAAAGPLASLVLAALLAGGGAAAGSVPWPPSLTGGPLEDQVAWMNLVLAAFNLVPALPMDGGRVLRAALTPRRGEAAATALATRLATALAVLMVVVGVLYDLWLALIGVFIMVGARGEQQASVVHLALGDRRVADLVVSGVLALPGETTVAEAVTANRRHPWWSVVVTHGDGYTGIVPPDRLAGARHDARLDTVADRRAPLLDAGDLLYPTAIEAFGRSRLRQLAVASQGRLVGLLDLDDIEWLARRNAPVRTR